MKKLFLMAVMSLCTLGLWAQSDENQESDKKRMEIAQTALGDRDRSGFFNVEAYLCLNDGVIEISAIGIGEADIYIVDANSRTIFCSVLTEDMMLSSVPIPNLAGNYTLVIWSDCYYGESMFTIN